jgi:hypothetical protein
VIAACTTLAAPVVLVPGRAVEARLGAPGRAGPVFLLTRSLLL